MPSPDQMTADAFHGGDFFLVQPARGGHRAGMDALVLAASVPGNFCGHLVDFGAGAGAVGLAVASRCPGVTVLLVEGAAEMLPYAEMTLAHPGNRLLSDRVSLLHANAGLEGAAREAAGLCRASADYILMNPPFNSGRDRTSPDDLRRRAHVMDDGLFEAWIKSAAAIARPRAGIAIIARPVDATPILTAMAGRFGGAELLAVHSKPKSPAIRIVVRARKGSRGGLSIVPPLMLQDESGSALSGRAAAIGAGKASLFGD